MSTRQLTISYEYFEDLWTGASVAVNLRGQVPSVRLLRITRSTIIPA